MDMRETEGDMKMDVIEAMEKRHSVRQFSDMPLDGGAVLELRKMTEAINRESGLHIQLITDEPEAFQAQKPSYGNFKGCRNYFALVGPKGKDEEIGYYGEQLVLRAQQFGINSCWVALTYKKGSMHCDIAPGEKRYMVIALGYGLTQGEQHKSKSAAAVSDYKEGDPEWYRKGVEAALLAPTAINQQKFSFKRNGEKVRAKAGFGPHARTDLGIVKYHFELGSGKGHDVWE
jgi:nitroreductase